MCISCPSASCSDAELGLVYYAVPRRLSLERNLCIFIILGFMVRETIGHISANGSDLGVRFSDRTFPVSTNHLGKDFNIPSENKTPNYVIYLHGSRTTVIAR